MVSHKILWFGHALLLWIYGIKLWLGLRSFLQRGHLLFTAGRNSRFPFMSLLTLPPRLITTHWQKLRGSSLFVFSRMPFRSKLHSAAPSGSWCGGQRQLSAANGSLVSGSRSGFNHHGVVLGCALQDSVGRDLVIQNHGAPACRFPLRADNGAEINLASLLQNFK